MAESEEIQEHLLLSLKELGDTSRSIIATAKLAVNDNVETFVSSKIGKLFQLVGLYKDVFKRLQVNTKSEFESKGKSYFRNQAIRDGFEDMLEAEQEWDDFLKDVDSQISTQGAPALREGEPGPVDEPLVDAVSGQEVRLADYVPHQQSLVLVLLRHFA